MHENSLLAVSAGSTGELHSAALRLCLAIVGGTSITTEIHVVGVGHNVGHREGYQESGYNTQADAKSLPAGYRIVG